MVSQVNLILFLCILFFSFKTNAQYIEFYNSKYDFKKHKALSKIFLETKESLLTSNEQIIQDSEWHIIENCLFEYSNFYLKKARKTLKYAKVSYKSYKKVNIKLTEDEIRSPFSSKDTILIPKKLIISIIDFVPSNFNLADEVLDNILFFIGHELGHILFNPKEDIGVSLEYYCDLLGGYLQNYNESKELNYEQKNNYIYNLFYNKSPEFLIFFWGVNSGDLPKRKILLFELNNSCWNEYGRTIKGQSDRFKYALDFIELFNYNEIGYFNESDFSWVFNTLTRPSSYYTKSISRNISKVLKKYDEFERNCGVKRAKKLKNVKEVFRDHIISRLPYRGSKTFCLIEDSLVIQSGYLISGNEHSNLIFDDFEVISSDIEPINFLYNLMNDSSCIEMYVPEMKINELSNSIERVYDTKSIRYKVIDVNHIDFGGLQADILPERIFHEFSIKIKKLPYECDILDTDLGGSECSIMIYDSNNNVISKTNTSLNMTQFFVINKPGFYWAKINCCEVQKSFKINVLKD